ncbi:MAG: beta-carotene 15,15'-dioxygenase, Brp/Blh family [Candidatus Kapaibacterium sp.]
MASVPTSNRPTLIILISAIVVAVMQELGLASSLPILGSAIALLGIPHGAVDHHMMGVKGGRRSADLLRYVAAIALVISVWLISPLLMLSLFLLNSAWHFGDCDVPNAGRLHWLRAFVYGASVLVLLVDPRSVSVRPIIEELLRTRIDMQLFSGLDSYRIAAAVMVMIIPAMVSVPIIRQRLIRSAIIIALAFTVDSLLAFTWYFTIVHALTSMNDLRHHLGGRFPWSWPELIVAALPLSLVSLAGIATAAMFLPQTSGIVALFVALSALTLPHSVLFHRIYKMR